MNATELTHPRTLEASTRCKDRGSCHDCAMVCIYSNTVTIQEGDSVFPRGSFAVGQKVPCGSDVFDKNGHIRLCGQCQESMQEVS